MIRLQETGQQRLSELGFSFEGFFLTFIARFNACIVLSYDGRSATKRDCSECSEESVVAQVTVAVTRFSRENGNTRSDVSFHCSGN